MKTEKKNKKKLPFLKSGKTRINILVETQFGPDGSLGEYKKKIQVFKKRGKE